MSQITTKWTRFHEEKTLQLKLFSCLFEKSTLNDANNKLCFMKINRNSWFSPPYGTLNVKYYDKKMRWFIDLCSKKETFYFLTFLTVFYNAWKILSFGFSVVCILRIIYGKSLLLFVILILAIWETVFLCVVFLWIYIRYYQIEICVNMWILIYMLLLEETVSLRLKQFEDWVYWILKLGNRLWRLLQTEKNAVRFPPYYFPRSFPIYLIIKEQTDLPMQILKANLVYFTNSN